MAVIFPLDEQALAAWVAERPPSIQKMVASHPPNRLYLLKSSNHRVTIYSYCENGTVTVNVTGEYNRVLFGRRVFGISLDDLVECDLPGLDEPLGDTSVEAGLTDQDVRDILIPEIKKRTGRK